MKNGVAIGTQHITLRHFSYKPHQVNTSATQLTNSGRLMAAMMKLKSRRMRKPAFRTFEMSCDLFKKLDP